MARGEAPAQPIRSHNADAALYLTTAVIGMRDPKLARDIAVAGRIAITVAQVASSWRTTSALGLLATGAGAGMATGGYGAALAAATTLLGDAAPSGSDPEIKALLAQVSYQIEVLREQMHERFDRVDARLHQIYKDMQAGFTKVEAALNQLGAEVAALRSEVQTLALRVAASESRILKEIARLRNDLIALNLAECVGWSEQTTALMPEPNFVTCLARLDVRAGAAPPVIEPFDLQPAAVAAFLKQAKSDSFVSAVPYLMSLARALEHPLGSFPATGSAPDPGEWAAAARAYVALAREWPEYWRKANLAPLVRIGNTGRALRNAVHRARTGVEGENLFATLIDQHRGALEALRVAAGRIDHEITDDSRWAAQEHESLALQCRTGVGVSSRNRDSICNSLGGLPVAAKAVPAVVRHAHRMRLGTVSGDLRINSNIGNMECSDTTFDVYHYIIKPQEGRIWLEAVLTHEFGEDKLDVGIAVVASQTANIPHAIRCSVSIGIVIMDECAEAELRFLLDTLPKLRERIRLPPEPDSAAATAHAQIEADYFQKAVLRWQNDYNKGYNPASFEAFVAAQRSATVLRKMAQQASMVPEVERLEATALALQGFVSASFSEEMRRNDTLVVLLGDRFGLLTLGGLQIAAADHSSLKILLTKRGSGYVLSRSCCHKYVQSQWLIR